MKRVAELCHQLIECDGTVRAQASAVLMQPAHDHLVVSLETFALRLDTLTGRLSCPLSDCEPARRLALAAADARPCELDRHTVLLFIRHLLFRALFLRAFAVNADPDVDAVCGDALMADDAMRTHFLQLLKDFAILDTLRRGYGFWPYYELIEECHDAVTEVLDDIIKDGRVEAQDKICSELTNEAVRHGYYWTLARKYFGIRYRAMRPADWLRVCDTNAPPHAPPSGFFHNLQVCCEESEEPWEQYRARWACAARAWSAAHGARPTLQPRLACVMPDLCAASLDLFVDCYYADNDTMLYDRSGGNVVCSRELGSTTWTEAAAVSGVASAMSALVRARGADLPAHHWDFINISLCSLVNSVRLSAEANQWPTTTVAMIARHVLELADQVATFVDEVPTLGTRRQLSDHVAALPTEWRDVFAPELYANLLLLAIIVLENGAKYGEEMVTTTHVVTVCALVRPIRRLRWPLVGAARRAQDLSPERLAAVCGAAFAAPAHPLYLRLAYYLLHCIMEPLFNDDVEKLKVWTDNENADDIERPRFSLHYFEHSLRRVQELANAALHAVTTGEATSEPAPASEAHRALLAHLLLSERLLSVARRAHDLPDLMEHYIAFFRGSDYIATLLCVCLRLVPARLLGPGTPPPEYASLFTTDPDFPCTGRTVILQYAGGECRKGTSKNCIQDSIAGPTFWNPILDSLLRKLREFYVYAQAFVNDVVLMSSGQSTQVLEAEVDRALICVSNWGGKNKVRFALSKIKVMVLTKKLKYDNPVVCMNQQKKSLADEIKILGRTIDKRLTFIPHVTQACKKATNIYKCIARAARVTKNFQEEEPGRVTGEMHRGKHR
ncbi:Putative 115 kDa protein in type-1 retrotransposable element R1DM [Eumeta japonica]|uniref:115 kDa protein in type-1 retrotransposable element R1DM n=1 Tax=Eumeta variegata TaxID=151549 RepID=A0A4C2A447_EUMVA|nr:Putative 115 kDa protein in type-1 retrotransposable element R1DM [Eumeta japonica]